MDTVLLVVSLSMFLTPALFLIYDRLRHRFGEAQRRAADEIDEQGPVIIAGMGRFGQVVNRMLTGLGHKTVVLDSHPETIERIRAFGVKGFFGDVGRPELLAAAGIASARAVVLALDDPEKTIRITAWIHRRYPEVKIIARARDRHHVYQLYAAGTPDSVREVFDSAVRAGKYALAALDYDAEEIERIAETFVAHDRHMLAELASSGTRSRSSGSRLDRQGARAERRDRATPACTGAKAPASRVRRRSRRSDAARRPG